MIKQLQQSRIKRTTTQRQKKEEMEFEIDFEMTYYHQCVIHYNNKVMNTPVQSPRLSQLATYEENHYYYDDVCGEQQDCEIEMFEYCINSEDDCNN